MKPAGWTALVRGAVCFVAAAALAAAGCQSTRDAGTRGQGQRTAAAADTGQTGGTQQSTAERRQQRAATDSMSLYYPTGSQRDAIVRVTKNVPQDVLAGDELTYTVTIENVSEFALTDVVVTEYDPTLVTPADAEAAGRRAAGDGRFARQGGAAGGADPEFPELYIRPLPGAGDNAAADRPYIREGRQDAQQQDARQPRPREGALTGGASYRVGDLMPGESRTIRVTSNGFSQAGRFRICTAVSYTPVLCAFVNVTQPELQLTKEGPRTADVGEAIAYRLTVTNSGVGTARSVQVVDRLPDGLEPAGNSQRTTTFNVGDLEAGQTRTMTVRAVPQRAGEFVNEATARAAGGLSDEARATTVVVAPRLAIRKTGPQRTYTNIDVPFEITVANTGNGVARSVTLTDTVPANARVVGTEPQAQVSGNQVTWNLGDLRPEQSRTVRIRIEATQPGDYLNRAVADAANTEPVRAEAPFAAQGVAGLLLEVIDQNDPIRVGGEEIYTIVVRNQGNVAAENVEVSAQFSRHLELIGAQGVTQAARARDGITFGAIPTLAPQANATWQVRVRGVREGDARINVRLTSDALETPVVEAESTQVFRVDIDAPQGQDEPDARPQGEAPEGDAPNNGG